MDLTIITSHLTDISVTGFIKVIVLIFLMHYCGDNFLILFVSDLGHSVGRIIFSKRRGLQRLHHCFILLTSVISPLVVLNNLIKIVVELLLFFGLAQKLLWDKMAVCQSLLLLLCHLLHAVVLNDNIERF